jgi:hypothetical protein
MVQQKQQLFVVGLPGAGKTTYLAALWHVVESSEVQSALRLVKLQGDATYLNQVRSLWVDAKRLERTKLSEQANLHMLLESADDSSCELWIPDLSGEAFEVQWTDRVASKEYCSYVRDSEGGLLFVHPHVREEHLITDINALVPQLPDEQDEEATTKVPDSADGVAVAWDARLAPTQVQLVDLLQFVMALRSGRAVRLSVVVSAWDLVKDQSTPEQWVKDKLSLLHQFLSTQGPKVQAKYFGISAQGGDIEDPTAVDALRKRTKPSDRIQVYDGAERIHDITAPIKWVIQGNGDADEGAT